MPEKANSDKSEDREKQNVDVLPPESKDKDMEEISGLLPSWREKTADTDLVHVTPLQKYLAEIRRHPLLTREQERELAVRYHDEGEVSAAYRLVVSNLRLVVKIAMDYRRAFVNVLDLIQEGNIGLMQAVSKYDPYKDVKLSSYAAWWIKAYILRYILNNWRLVKMGTTQAQRKLVLQPAKGEGPPGHHGHRTQPRAHRQAPRCADTRGHRDGEAHGQAGGIVGSAHLSRRQRHGVRSDTIRGFAPR